MTGPYSRDSTTSFGPGPIIFLLGVLFASAVASTIINVFAYTLFNNPQNNGYVFVIGIGLPISMAAVFGIVMGISSQNAADREAAKNKRHSELVEKIKDDPEIIFREKWHEDKGDKKRALSEVVGNFREYLRREDLVRLMSVTSEYDLKILYSTKLAPDFLEIKYSEYSASSDEEARYCLIAIVRNSNTPLNVLETAAALPDQESSLVKEAKRRLAERIQATAPPDN